MNQNNKQKINQKTKNIFFVLWNNDDIQGRNVQRGDNRNNKKEQKNK